MLTYAVASGAHCALVRDLLANLLYILSHTAHIPILLYCYIDVLIIIILLVTSCRFPASALQVISELQLQMKCDTSISVYVSSY